MRKFSLPPLCSTSRVMQSPLSSELFPSLHLYVKSQDSAGPRVQLRDNKHGIGFRPTGTREVLATPLGKRGQGRCVIHNWLIRENFDKVMKNTVKCDAALLKLLQHRNTEDVDFLVDVLTHNGAGRVALSSSIKDLLLHQKAEINYTEDGLRNLLHELQQYGGHSVINIFRNEPIPYSELLADVHKKLNGKDSKTKSDWEKEREIVFCLFGESWRTMKDQDRWDRCTEVRVVSGFFNMQENLNINENGVVSALSAAASAAAFVALKMFPPAAVASTLGLGFQSMSEAYRITIPFIVQIARIKMLAAEA